MTEETAPALESLVAQARGGSSTALDRLLRAIQDDVYGLAVRMLWHPHDAEDATQEILLRIVTHLGTFRGESAFKTWAYRVATNHLLNVRKGRVERSEMTFSEFAEDLAHGLADPPAPSGQSPDQGVLEEEVMVGCTLAMLHCLDREHRLAYILGEILDLPGDDAAYIAEVPGSTYRKRLSRARQRIREFMRGNCGLVDRNNACRCSRRIVTAVERGHVTPHDLLFARGGRGEAVVTAHVRDLEEIERAAAMYRAHPPFGAPDTVRDEIDKLLKSDVGRRVLR